MFHHDATAAPRAQRPQTFNPIAPHFDALGEWLRAQGYAEQTVRHAHAHARRFGDDLARRGLDELAGLTEDDAEAFLRRLTLRAQSRLRSSGARSVRSSLRQLFRFLRAAGIVAPAPVSVAADGFPGLLDEYLTFLRHHRGLRDATLYAHRRWGREFLQHLAVRLPRADFSALTVPLIDEFVRPRIRSAGRGTQSQVMQAVRGLLRHLHRSGRVADDLVRFVQGPRRYSLASVPTALSVDEVHRLLTCVDRASPLGRRNYAILLLLAVYGLRAREVVDLRLDDLDWRAGRVRVRRSKSSRELVLPLTAAVGRALVAYLRRGRPRTAHRELFVRHCAPYTPFRKSSAVYQVVRHALDHADIAVARRGPHVLRHTVATQLVRHGFSLKVVGDLLGHQHPDSTLPYTKLAIEDLREVALEVPESGR